MSSAVSSALASGVNETDLPLAVPAGFAVETLADDLPGARVVVRDFFGNFWVSRPSEGTVSLLEMSGSLLLRHDPQLRNLDKPHGLAIDPENGLDLYVAEERKITRYRLYSDAPPVKIADLPAGGRHTTRTLGFGPDGRLYVSIGSTCDVCVEADARHGSILSIEKDGSAIRAVATGLRNAVFFTWHPDTGSLYATEMGRDRLGDDLPPEEVNIVTQGAHYGWPYCYGERVRDETFRPSDAFECANTDPPAFTLPAHTAPLGLAFLQGEGWPAEYRDDLLVALHGSWNSTVPVGYKIVRIPLDARGNRTGETEDFLAGFRSDGTVHGRPVDLLSLPDGTLLVTDDRAGAVYRLRAR